MSDAPHSLCNGLDGEYSFGLHIGAIFVVLFASLLGACLPILTTCIPILKKSTLFFVIAKTAATGVLISVSSIHLINDASDNFHEECVNESFREFYSAYAIFFAMVAALLMHALDLQLAVVTESWMRKKHEKEKEMRLKECERDNQQDISSLGGCGCPGTAIDNNSNSSPANDREGCCENAHEMTGKKASCCSPDDGVQSGAFEGEQVESSPMTPVKTSSGMCTDEASMGDGACAQARATASDAPIEAHLFHSRATATARSHHGHSHGHHAHQEDGVISASDPEPIMGDAHGHSHAIVLPPDEMPQIRRVIAAICMEFGVTLHSVFVGLDIGLTTDRDLKPLLIALVFHQLFEGVSLGSRLVDAKFATGLEIVLAVIFSVSAPLGMAAATIAVSIKKDSMSGGGFVLMMAVLSSFCGGILLYLAFNLLFTDFANDLRVFGPPERPWRRLGLFLALWVGFISMAIVGKWL